MYKIFILTSFLVYSFLSNQSHVVTKKFKVGLSVCSTSDTWRKTMIELMQNELLIYPDIQLIIKDAKGNSEMQQKHINEFIDQGIDLLIISPNIVTPIKSSIDKVNDSDIPILLIDRKIIGANYTSYMGGNNYKIGYDAGVHASKLLNGNGRIIEIKGYEGSSPTIERNKGFHDAISKFPNIKIVFSEFGNWESGSAELIMKKAINEGLEFDLVFAYNDLMAQEASKYIITNNLKKKCYVIGVDGLPGNNRGIQAVIDRQIDATFYYPPQGDKIIKIANSILHHLPYNKENFIDAILIDSTNAKGLKSQSFQIENLQVKIDKQKKALSIEVSKYKTQHLILIFILVSLVLILTLIVFIFKAIHNKKTVNKLLEREKITIENKNTSIKFQQKELVKVTEKLEEATNSKLALFTKISHEFKTPLTLITGPLEFLIKSKNFSLEDEQQLRLMYRNSIRLLRLVNQLIDFQNLEKNQLKLNASECDFISFLNEKEETFMYLAQSNNIEFKFVYEIKKISLWIDHDMMDKVFYNLLSNAFKFT
ncbi:MAG TPA: substrate-binding domain-containing protein, partial [Flavobacterium sp.]